MAKRRKRRLFGAAFRAKVDLAAAKGDKTLAELATPSGQIIETAAKSFGN